MFCQWSLLSSCVAFPTEIDDMSKSLADGNYAPKKIEEHVSLCRGDQDQNSLRSPSTTNQRFKSANVKNINLSSILRKQMFFE